MIIKYRHLVFVLLSFLNKNADAFPQSEQNLSNTKKQKFYLSLSLNRNKPVSSSQQKITTKEYRPGVRLKIFHLENWLIGIGIDYKKFYTKENNEDLPMVITTQETYYLLRLYHPTYLGAGFKLQYLRPIKPRTGRLSLTKHPSYKLEYAGALSTSILHHLSHNWLLSIHFDLWRGFGSSTFQGIEWGASIGYRI